MNKCAEMSASYISLLKAVNHIHNHNHWLTKGDSFYGNHLLFEKIYNSASDNLDKAAEKCITLFGDECAEYKKSNKLMFEFLSCFDDCSEDQLLLSLSIENKFLEFSKEYMNCLKEHNSLSMGMDDMIMSICSDREDAVYLLSRAMDESDGEGEDPEETEDYEYDQRDEDEEEDEEEDGDELLKEAGFSGMTHTNEEGELHDLYPYPRENETTNSMWVDYTKISKEEWEHLKYILMSSNDKDSPIFSKKLHNLCLEALEEDDRRKARKCFDLVRKLESGKEPRDMLLEEYKYDNLKEEYNEDGYLSKSASEENLTDYEQVNLIENIDLPGLGKLLKSLSEIVDLPDPELSYDESEELLQATWSNESCDVPTIFDLKDKKAEVIEKCLDSDKIHEINLNSTYWELKLSKLLIKLLDS